MFDTITIDGRRYQTKALGAWGNRLVTGDTVRAQRPSRSAEEEQLSRTHQYPDLPDTYTVEAVDERDHRIVVVEIAAGKIQGIVSEPRPTHFDYAGRSIGAEHHVPTIKANPEWQRQRAASIEAVNAVLLKRRKAK